MEQVTLTTNGIGLKKNLPALLESRIDGVNISLDTLDSEQYRQITGRDGSYRDFGWPGGGSVGRNKG